MFNFKKVFIFLAFILSVNLTLNSSENKNPNKLSEIDFLKHNLNPSVNISSMRRCPFCTRPVYSEVDGNECSDEELFKGRFYHKKCLDMLKKSTDFGSIDK